MGDKKTSSKPQLKNIKKLEIFLKKRLENGDTKYKHRERTK